MISRKLLSFLRDWFQLVLGESRSSLSPFLQGSSLSLLLLHFFIKPLSEVIHPRRNNCHQYILIDTSLPWPDQVILLKFFLGVKKALRPGWGRKGN